MLLKKTKSWINKSENLGTLFFIQRMDELIYPYTMDSYRAATTNAPFLILESLRVLSDHEDHDINPAHIERIWEELEDRMSGNFVANSMLTMPWEEYGKVDRKNLEALKGTLQVLKVEVQPIKYLKRCFDIVKTNPQSHLKNFDFLAREICTTIVNCGVDVKWVSWLLDEHFFREEAPEGEDSVDSFFKKLMPNRSVYTIHTTIKTDAGKIKKDIRGIFDIEFSDDEPKEISEHPEGLSAAAGEIYVSIDNVTAPDPFTALNNAKRNIARMHDLYGLFYHKGSYQIGTHAIAIYNTDEQAKDERNSSYVLRADANSMELIKDNRRGRADRKLESLIKNVMLPGGKDSEKFFRVVDFHGMSLGSKVPENQLINLWTSLETIAPSQKGNSIIGSVIGGVVPFICLQYFSKIFTNLARDIKRWDDDAFKDALKRAEIPVHTSIAEKAFHLTMLKENDAHCTELLEKMNEFPLLRNRIYSINKKAQSGKEFSTWLESHQKRVEHQLYRIYRTRNSIVHSATDPAGIENLIVSAHDYFDQVFSLSSEMCGSPFGFSNYADCFNFARMSFENYKRNLEKIENIDQESASKIVWTYSVK